MKTTLKEANIVIIANSFNPSIVTKDWLINKGVIKEREQNFTNTPGFSFFQSENFSITLMPDRFQLELRRVSEVNLEELAPIAERFITLLPETPYTAVGTNYIWQTEAEGGEDVAKILKDIFTFNYGRFTGVFREEDVSLGSILWLHYDGFLMKLSIEPLLSTKKHILCNFNYHADISGVSELKNRLSMFTDTFKHSKEIVDKLFGGE